MLSENPRSKAPLGKTRTCIRTPDTCTGAPYRGCTCANLARSVFPEFPAMTLEPAQTCFPGSTCSSVDESWKNSRGACCDNTAPIWNLLAIASCGRWRHAPIPHPGTADGTRQIEVINTIHMIPRVEMNCMIDMKKAELTLAGSVK